MILTEKTKKKLIDNVKKLFVGYAIPFEKEYTAEVLFNPDEDRTAEVVFTHKKSKKKIVAHDVSFVQDDGHVFMGKIKLGEVGYIKSV
jgi:hypothetical protein